MVRPAHAQRTASEQDWSKMALTAEPPNFDAWLSKKLQELKTDEGVFGSYIKGILEGDETEDEKTEALECILAGITDDNIGKHVSEILRAWAEWLAASTSSSSSSSSSSAAAANLIAGRIACGAAGGAAARPPEDVDVRLARMLESQTLPTTTQRSYTDEERRIREAILAQYSQMSDEESSERAAQEDGTGAPGDYCGIERNTNAITIAQQERERREKAKLESQRKKEKDKEDREKQRQSREEKKEKRKTQKGERRR